MKFLLKDNKNRNADEISHIWQKKKKEDLYMHICTSALYSIGADICATDCELDQFVNGCVCQAESWGKKKQTSSEVQPQPQPPMQCA